MSIGLSFLVFMLLVSLLTLAAAIAMAVRPSERTLALIRPLSMSTVMSILSSTAAGLALALQPGGGPSVSVGSADATRRLLAGLSESMATAVLGFSVLAVSWLLVAYGIRRRV